MSLMDLNKKPKRRMDFNSSIDYLLGEKTTPARRKPKSREGLVSVKKPKIEIIKYNVELTSIEKVVLIVEVILVAWYVLAKFKILPIF